MRTSLMILLATALSAPSAFAGCDPPQTTSAERIADAIDRTGQAAPLIAFYRGTSTIKESSNAQLVELARLLEHERDLKIELSIAAEDAREPALAAARVAAVRDALLGLNAPASRVTVVASQAGTAPEFAALSGENICPAAGS